MCESGRKIGSSSGGQTHFSPFSVQALSRLVDCSHTWMCGLLYSLCRFRFCSLTNLTTFPTAAFLHGISILQLNKPIGSLSALVLICSYSKIVKYLCTVPTPGVGEIERNLNYKTVRFHRKRCAKKDILVMLAIQNEESWVRISSSNPGNKENSFSKLWGWESEFRGRTL